MKYDIFPVLTTDKINEQNSANTEATKWLKGNNISFNWIYLMYFCLPPIVDQDIFITINH